ncbi:precorrin-3B C(17)-methyltransferase [Clostridioides mangenotii]|uniref:precorrin-3B C(17)-methyltransferase n=1 Tax=Metaclostridioides mangenotii TaxID=1540 RepID=UPI001C1138E3|nr:precorrin-3B C(17)-methyltransferase [Clostridioides mangenotii]MBU5308617.1 precorrin-3B C(17)-methyltransferase [Clostridioides mangenotii]MCR1954978.1 precorrin-3B C(17)-methyltransferase [Clostridioides mangenotii]
MIYVIGIGPGNKEWMTLEALDAIEKSNAIVGYKTYIKLIEELIEGKEVIENGMRQEIDRCKRAIEEAKGGKTVAVISSGDAGIYGMAGLILELVSKEEVDIQVKVVPGITASIGAAALLGAPIMHDFCHISLSDLLTPWEVIEKRLKLAADADFVICLYNARSKGRSEHLKKAFDIMKEYKCGDIPVGIVKDVGRENQDIHICTFDTMDFERVDMTTMVVIGNKSTFINGDKIITPRGYVL